MELIDTMKTYPKMKETSIPWLGKIPEHWEVRKIKHFYQRKVEKNLPDGEVLSLYRDLGIVIKSSREDNFNRTSEDTSNYNVVAVYDLVINKMKAWQGSVAVSEHHGIVSPAYYVCSPINNNVYWQYAHHLLRAAVYHPEYRRLSEGIRLGQWDLSYDDWKNISFLLPPIAEQYAIAAYLDKATVKIDALIAEQEKLCTLLAEKRKALISHVVTKGLDSKVKLKDSGIAWLGKIPEHWEIKKLSWLFFYSKGASAALLTKEYVAENVGDYPVYSGQTENKGLMGMINWHEFSFTSPVIFVTTVGARAMSTRVVSGKFSLSQNCALIIPRDTKADTHYYEAVFCVLFDYERRSISLIMQPSLRFDDLNKFRVPLPPPDEQRIIAAYLDKATAKLDALAAKAEEAIALLKERRSALISEVVTGKVKVS